MKIPKISDVKGFTLVEALVVAGILAGLSVVVMKVMEVQTRGSKRIFQDQSIQQALNEVNTIFAREETCKKSLENVNIGAGDSGELTVYRKSGSNFVKRYNNTDMKKISNSVDIESIKARKDPDAPLGNNERGSFEVMIKFKRKGSTTSYVTKFIKVIGKLENGIVNDCVSYEIEAIEEMRRQICEDDLGGQINANDRCVKSGGSEGMLVKESACEILGGSLVAGKCTAVDVSGAVNAGSLQISGQVRISGGSPGPDKVLASSDTSGLASWQTISNISNVTNSRSGFGSVSATCPAGKEVVYAMGFVSDFNRNCYESGFPCSGPVFVDCIGDSSCTFNPARNRGCTVPGPSCIQIICQ